MDPLASINSTRKGFEESFSTGEFYNKQTQDFNHLEKILEFIGVKDDMKILDLGAGSGYLTFPIAKMNASCQVIGLDIVKEALKANSVKAEKEGIKNISFVNYDGIDFPLESNSLDMVVTRYALHHFPDIKHSVREVSRVLKKGGIFFISDPCPNDCDTERFVDDYMQRKPDGHIKFYTKKEWETICGQCGLKISDSFNSSIRFPRKKDTSYEAVLKRHSKTVIESYNLVETDDEIYITEQVNNIIFVKQ